MAARLAIHFSARRVSERRDDSQHSDDVFNNRDSGGVLAGVRAMRRRGP